MNFSTSKTKRFTLKPSPPEPLQKQRQLSNLPACPPYRAECRHAGQRNVCHMETLPGCHKLVAGNTKRPNVESANRRRVAAFGQPSPLLQHILQHLIGAKTNKLFFLLLSLSFRWTCCQRQEPMTANQKYKLSYYKKLT